MARYHYDISGDHPFPDDEGAEHSNDDSAWAEAVRAIRDAEELLRPGGKWVLTVRKGDRAVFVIEITARKA